MPAWTSRPRRRYTAPPTLPLRCGATPAWTAPRCRTWRCQAANRCWRRRSRVATALQAALAGRRAGRRTGRCRTWRAAADRQRRCARRGAGMQRPLRAGRSHPRGPGQDLGPGTPAVAHRKRAGRHRHADFAHHRDGALRLLGLPPGPGTDRAQVAQALQGLARRALRAGSRRRRPGGGCAAAIRPVGRPPAIGSRGRAAGAGDRSCRSWPAGTAGPCTGARPAPVAGPARAGPTRIRPARWPAGRLPRRGRRGRRRTARICPTSNRSPRRAAASCRCTPDLKTAAGRETLRGRARGRCLPAGLPPGWTGGTGLRAVDLARALRPGIVCLSLSAYGDSGPWAGRRGFDSLVQTATGFNHAEAAAFGTAEPLGPAAAGADYSAGFLLAFGAQAALLRRREGGSWQVRLSLARTAQRPRSLGRCSGFQGRAPARLQRRDGDHGQRLR